MKPVLFILAILASSTPEAKTFEIKNVSPYFDVKVDVEKCGEWSCEGKATYSFYRKNTSSPYQVIQEPEVHFMVDEKSGQPVDSAVNPEAPGAIYVADYNFDDMDDIAICTGQYGAYGYIGYRTYLSSKKKHQFVYSEEFVLGGLYVPMVDLKKKVLVTHDKDGCCWHITREYKVSNNKPQKIKEIIEDATDHVKDETKMKVTTKTRVNGRWQTRIKMVPRPE